MFDKIIWKSYINKLRRSQKFLDLALTKTLICGGVSLFIGMSACQKKSDTVISASNQVTPSPTSMPIIDATGNAKDLPFCQTNGTNSTPCFVVRDQYYYNTEYGGRNGPQVTTNMTAANGIGKVNLTDGWYSDGIAVTFSDTNLKDSNIRSGVTIFGITGTYSTSAANSCASANGTITPPCVLARDTYLYTTDHNGRANLCTIPTTGTNPTDGTSNSVDCFVSTNMTLFLSANGQGKPSSCTTEGLQTNLCLLDQNKYNYSTSFGGRSQNCIQDASANDIGTTPNASPCWLNITSGTLMVSQASGTPQGCSIPGLFSTIPCSTPNGKSTYLYRTPYGGRSASCINDANGNCWVAQNSFTDLDPNLVKTNIVSGVNIFGVIGSFKGIGVWNSGAGRMASTQPITLTDESITYAGNVNPTMSQLPDGYHEVPLTTLDDEGTDPFSVIQRNIYPVDRTGWGTIQCGLDSTDINNLGANNSIKARIADCGLIFGTGATWDGSQQGNAGQTTWQLVTRVYNATTANVSEVWLDKGTGMLWSSLVSRSINWCQASGNSNASNVTDSTAKESDPSGICTTATYQDQTNAYSACYEDTGFTNSKVGWEGASAKGNFNKTQSTTTPAVRWRIPTILDYEIAEYDGIRMVLPDMGGNLALSDIETEWTGTTHANWTGSSYNYSSAWTFNSRSGAHALSTRSTSSNVGVRCIGRANLN